MKKIIVIILGIALIVGVTILLVNPKEELKGTNKAEENEKPKLSTKTATSSSDGNLKTVKGEVSPTKNDSSDKSEERLYTKEELDAAVSKAEVEMAEAIMRETVSEEDVTETANSVVSAFEESNQTTESSEKEATINNYIHENGVYDKLAEKGVAFSGVECREAACKLRFEVSDTDDNLERRMPKMFSISEEMQNLGLIKDMEAIITNDFEGRSLQYYYY